MKLLHIQAAIGSAILLLSSPCEAKHPRQLSHLEVMGRRHNHKRAHSSPRVETIEDGGSRDGLKRRGTCDFPHGSGLVAVTPGSSNAGWAMSPDQPCTPGNYCPYACPPGQVMAQWNPLATSYTYPLSMDGGLYCDSDGKMNKPFPNKDYCVDGTGSVSAVNNAGSTVAFCQTVLPGNEAMLIPTAVDSTAVLAVPGTSYWCETAAHYYINAPGISTADACIWGDGTEALGNWSPYVAGANTDSSGNTFVKIGWNPIYTGCSFSKVTPSFGVKIVCSGSGCNGEPCSIDPSVNGVGGVTSSDQASGAGGANFCVVTVPQGETASIIVFNSGDSSSSSSSNGAAKAADLASSVKSTSTTPSPTPTPTPTSTTGPKSTHTSTTQQSSTKASSSSQITSSYPAVSSGSRYSSLITLLPSSGVNTTSASPTGDNAPHILFENATTTASGVAIATGTGLAGLTDSGNSTVAGAAAATSTKKSLAPEKTLVSSSLFSLVVLFAVAGYML